MILKNLFTNNVLPLIEDNSKEDLCFMKYGPIQFYWNNCSQIYDEKGSLNFNSWDNIKYLDYKVTRKMFEFEESYNCIDQFINNKQSKKMLHIVNTHHDNKSIFELPEWNILVNHLNKYTLGTTVIEVVNKFISDDEIYQVGIKKCNEIFDPAEIEYILFTDSETFIHDNKKYIDSGRMI